MGHTRCSGDRSCARLIWIDLGDEEKKPDGLVSKIAAVSCVQMVAALGRKWLRKVIDGRLVIVSLVVGSVVRYSFGGTW